MYSHCVAGGVACMRGSILSAAFDTEAISSAALAKQPGAWLVALDRPARPIKLFKCTGNSGTEQTQRAMQHILGCHEQQKGTKLILH